MNMKLFQVSFFDLKPFNSGKRIYFFLFILLFFNSCQRKAIHKKHPDMSGGWHHIEYPNKNR